MDTDSSCTLPVDELGERLAWIRREILPNTIETERMDRGLAFELTAAPGLAAKLDQLIELERRCCSGIAFERLESRTTGQLRLEIRGVDPDSAVFHSLRTPSPASPHPGSRLAKAAGLGVVTSLLVCCVLPIAAGALLGAAAAPLAALDGPVPIGTGALVGGSAAWWWLGRRRAKAETRGHSATTACGPGC